MRELARQVRLYFLIVGQFVKARLSYRADFAIASVGMLLLNAPGLLGLVIVFRNIPRLAGWSFPELVLMYGFALLAVSPLQLLFEHIWYLRYEVQDGRFIKYYFRPLNMMLYYMSEMIDLKAVSQVAMGAGLVTWASHRLGLVWTWKRVLGVLCLLGSGGLTMIGLMVIAGSMAFWIGDSFSVLVLISRFRDYARYPLSIFNGTFRFLFSAVIPIGFVAFYPARWLLRPDAPALAAYGAPAVGVGMFALGYLVWERGTRRWGATGS